MRIREFIKLRCFIARTLNYRDLTQELKNTYRSFREYLALSFFVRATLQHMHDPEIILDLGFGIADKSAIIASLLPNTLVIGLDYNVTNAKAGKLVKGLCSSCSFIICDVRFMPIKEDCIDSIFMYGVFEHVGEADYRTQKQLLHLKKAFKEDYILLSRMMLLREICRVLKKKGITYIGELPKIASLEHFFSKLGLKVHKTECNTSIEHLRRILEAFFDVNEIKSYKVLPYPIAYMLSKLIPLYILHLFDIAVSKILPYLASYLEVLIVKKK